MQKAAIYGIIAAAVVAAGVGIAFAVMPGMSNTPITTNQQSTNNNEVRVIEHALGETEITGTPERVVALYSVQVGNVRALGVMPVGVADLDFQNELLSPVGLQLSEDVVHVGTPSEPNFETLLQLEPDLIVGGAFQAEIYDELSEIAPTILFAEEPTEELNELEVAERNIMAIADALNRHDEGVAYLDGLDSLYAEAAAKIDQAGLTGTEFVLIESWLQNGAPHMYVTKENGLFSLVLNQTGLKSAVPADYVLEPGYENAGWYQTSMEGLSTLDGPDVRILNSHGGENPLESSPLWDNLEFAQNGHVYSIGEIRTDQFAYTEMLVNRVVEALTGNQSETRTINHAMGETEITGTPQRIVALSWQSGSDLLTLGVKPVGIVNADMFNEIVNLDQVVLPPDVAGVGLPFEPNLEVIAGLEPDLIIGSMHDHELLYEDLSEIAPTVLFHVFVQFPGQEIPSELELMEQNFMTVADIVGKHDQGAAVIESMNASFDEAAASLQAAGLQDSRFTMAYIQNDATNIWLWIDALNTQVLERIGMENAYKTAYEEAYPGEYDFGGVGWDLEGLTLIDEPDVHFIFREHATDTGVPDAWQDNPVWNNLEFVKAGNVHPHESLYVYAGPLAAETLADTVVELLTSDGS